MGEIDDNEKMFEDEFFIGAKNLLRETMNSSTNIVYFKNLNNNHYYLNNSWKKNFGSITRNINDIFEKVHPDDKSLFQTKFQSFLKNEKEKIGKSERIECRIKNLKEKYLYYDLTARTFESDKQKFLIILCIDITQRKQQEEEIYKKNQTLNELLEHTPDIITRYDKNLIYTYVNGIVEKIYGISPKDVIGKTNKELEIPKEITSLWNNSAKEVFTTGKSKNIEFLFKQENNDRWYQMQMVPEFDKSGTVDTVLTIARDITKHKLFEKDLEESEERYRKMFENTSNGICIYRFEDKGNLISLIDINKAAETIEKVNKKNVIGKSIVEIFPIAERIDLFKNLTNAWKTNIPQNFTIKIYKDNNVLLKWSKHYAYKLPSGEVIDVFTDQTQSKLAQQKLKETYERYETLTEQNLMAIIITQDSRIKYLNSAAANLVGYSRDEILSWGFGEYKKLIHPDDLDYVLKLDALAAEKQKNGEIFNFTYRLLDNDGNIKWVEQYSREIKFNNKIADFITLIDITEKKQIETALSESEAKLRSLVESAEDIIEMLDQNGLYLYYHEPNCYTDCEKEYIGKTPYDIFEKEKANEIMEQLHQVIETGSGITVENLNTNNSTKAWFSTRISPIYDEDGSIKGIVKISRNVTAQKEAENSLKESEDLFRMFAEETIYGLLIIQNHSIKYINRGAEKIFGYKFEEFKDWNQQDYNNLIHPKDKEKALNYLYDKKKESKDQFEHFSNRIISKSGKIVWIEVYSKSIIYEGQNALLLTILDITDRKRAEDDLRQSLEEKKILLKEIHHRVKNNLQIIASLLRIQSRKIKNQEDLQLLMNAINQVTSMSLIHKNLYQSDNLASINLADYIKSISDDLYKSYGVNQDFVQIDVNIEPILLKIDYAMPCGLIIGELMSNSLKYAFPNGRKGKIGIILKKIADHRVKLTVWDNGVGVPDYFNVGSLKTTGFHLVKNLTEFQLNGKLEIEKNAGLKVHIIFKLE